MMLHVISFLYYEADYTIVSLESMLLRLDYYSL